MSRPSITIERGDDVTRVSVPMPLPYWPVPNWLAVPDLIGLVVTIPLSIVWMFVAAGLRHYYRIAPPPRALFEIDARLLRITFWCRESGERTSAEYPRHRIVEIRKNRYGKGLWLRAQGIKMVTYLDDMPDDMIEALGQTLSSILLPDAGVPIAP